MSSNALSSISSLDYHTNLVDIQNAFREAEKTFFHDEMCINVLKVRNDPIVCCFVCPF